MRIRTGTRTLMTNQLALAINGTTSKEIQILDASNTLLATWEYDRVEPDGTEGDLVFVAPDETNNLKASVVADGDAVKFLIPLDGNTADAIIEGAVTLQGLGGDIQFSDVGWTIDMTVSISNLTIIAPNKA